MPLNPFNFFTSQGWSPAQAAGIVGNLRYESGFDPARYGDGGQAYGIGQWHPARQRIFARVMGRPIQGSSVDQQLQFVQYELTHNEMEAGNLLRGQTSVAGATSSFMNMFERPSASARVNSIGDRVRHALGAAGGVIENAGNSAQSALENIPGMSILFGVRDNILGQDSPTGSCGANPFCYLKQWINESSFFQRIAMALFAFIVIFAAFYLMKERLD